MENNHKPLTVETTRRDFLKVTSAVAAGLTLAAQPVARAADEKLALNGGPKAVTNKLTGWPHFDENAI